MPLASLLLLSFVTLAIVVSVASRSTRLRRALLRPAPVASMLLASVVSSTASAVIRTSGASGTGIRTAFGFPKPFYFTWTSWERPVSQRGVVWLYFAGNCVGWLALVSVVALLWIVLRPRSAAARG